MQERLPVPVSEPGVWMDGGLSYPAGDGSPQALALLRPMSPGPHPCLLWLGGGAWQTVTAYGYLPMLAPLVRSGYAVASVEYRCDAAFPAPLDDVKAALRFLRANASHYDLRADAFGLMGESAGGHLALLAGFTRTEKDLPRPLPVCAWYPPVDLTLTGEAYSFYQRAAIRLAGSADWAARRRASPAAYVSSACPPCLLFHGDADDCVPPAQSELLHRLLSEAGVPVELCVVPDAGHADVRFFQPEIWIRVERFFEKQLS